jgi:hypothetical protein
MVSKCNQSRYMQKCNMVSKCNQSNDWLVTFWYHITFLHISWYWDTMWYHITFLHIPFDWLHFDKILHFYIYRLIGYILIPYYISTYIVWLVTFWYHIAFLHTMFDWLRFDTILHVYIYYQNVTNQTIYVKM